MRNIFNSHYKFVLFVVLSLVFISFSSSLLNQFIGLDDPAHLVENINVRELTINNIVSIFQNVVCDIYIPLTVLSFAIEYHFFKLMPFIYHFDNLLLHLLVTALIYCFAKRLGLYTLAAGMGALLFGIHPMHVESVVWVTERKDVLYAAFYMLSIYQYWLYLEDGKKRLYWGSVFFGFLSILAKPMALTLPIILCILDFFHKRSFKVIMTLNKIPYFVYIVPITFMTLVHQNRSPSGNVLEVVLIAIWSFMFYIIKFIYPVEISPLYQVSTPVEISNPTYLFSLLLFFIYMYCLVRYWKHWWFTLANLFYIGSIFPLIRFAPYLDVSIVADRFMYLPSLGYCLLAGFLLEKFMGFRGVIKGKFQIFRIACVVVVFISLSIKTYQQAKVWKDDFTLWEEVVRRVPQHPYAYFARARMYEDRGEIEKAIWNYTSSLYFSPTRPKAYNNRGVLYEQQGRYDLAFADYTKAIQLDPEFSKAYNNRGLVYYYFFHDEQSLNDFNKSIEINAVESSTYVNRAKLYSHTNKHQLAIKDLTRAIALGANKANIYYARSKSYENIHAYEEALRDARKAYFLGKPEAKTLVQNLMLFIK